MTRFALRIFGMDAVQRVLASILDKRFLSAGGRSEYRKSDVRFTPANVLAYLFNKTGIGAGCKFCLQVLVLVCLAQLSSQALAQTTLTSISPSSATYTAQAAGETVTGNFSFVAGSGELLESFRFCVPNCADMPDDNFSTFNTGGSGGATSPSGGSSWRYQYNCTDPGFGGFSECNAQIAFTPIEAGTYTAEWLINSETESILIKEPGRNSESFNTAQRKQTASAQLTGILEPEPTGTIQFDQESYTVAEDAGSLTVNLIRVGGFTGGLNVDFFTEDGTAKQDSDYSANSGGLGWGDGNLQSQSITIPILLDDDFDEGSEDFFIRLSNDLSARVVITDSRPEPEPDPGVIQFNPVSYNVLESDGSVTLTATRTDGSDGQISVIASTRDGTSLAGEDYSAGSVDLVWGDGDSRSQTFSLSVLPDAIEESDETFFVDLSQSDTDGCCDDQTVIGPDSTATVTISNVPLQIERGVVQFSSDSYSVDEDAGTVSLPVERIGGSDGAISITVSTEDGTATSGSDYEQTSRVLSWNDGDSGTRIFTVPIVQDTGADSDNADTETFTASLSVGGNEDNLSLLGDITTATITINNVLPEPAGFITFAMESETVAEGQSISVVLVREGGSNGEINTSYSTIGQSATAGEDFTSQSGELFWDDDDTAPQSIEIPVLTDNDGTEGDEIFTVVLGNERSIRINITDVPPTPAGTILLDRESYRVSEQDDSVTVSLSRVGGSRGELSVDFFTVDGSAIAGSDYTGQSGSLDWSDGDTETQSISIPILSDNNDEEGDEDFFIELDDGSRAQVVITDFQPVRRGIVQFSPVSYNVSESTGSVRVTATRTGGADGMVTVRAITSDATATAGEDYTALSTDIVWTDNDSEDKSFSVSILADNIEEEAESFSIALVAPNDDDQSLIGADSRATVTLSDVPPTNAGTLEFSQETYSTSEEDGEVTITVNRTGGSAGAVSVEFESISGSAQADSDFDAVSGELTWADGDASAKEFTVAILDDALVEDSEQFTVVLANPLTSDSGILELGQSSATVVIQDSTDIGQIQFVSAGYSSSEAVGEVVLEVERFGGDTGAVSVDYRLESGTAEEGADFVANSGTLSWDDGETGIKPLVVQLQNDNVIEGTEVFIAVLDNALPLGATQLTTASATIEIMADADGDVPSNDITPATYLLEVVSGDNQSVLPGDELDPLVLQASLQPDATGLLEGLTINWRVFPVGSAVLENGNQTTTDASGQASNEITVVSRGFVSVIASVLATKTDANDNQIGARINPPPVELASTEIAFTVRAGLFAAPGLTNNQAQTGQALDATCEALDGLVEALTPITAGQEDLLQTCRELETRLDDGSVAAALDRLAPEEVFSLGDSVIDATDLQITNVYSRIFAIRSKRSDAFDLSGLNIDIQDQSIPGTVFEAAQNEIFSGGAASDDDIGAGVGLGAYVNGSISVGEVDGDLNQRSADLSTNAVTVGADYQLSANTIIGTAIGLTNSETNFNSEEGGVDMSAVNWLLYGTYYQESRGYLDAVLDIGRTRFDITRQINLPGFERRLASGDTSANIVSLTLGAGFDARAGAFEFGPYGRISFTSANVEAYQEQSDSQGEGFGSVLSLDAHSVQSTTASLGLQLSRAISTSRGVFIPQLRLEAEFEGNENKDGIRATFENDPSQTVFEIQGNPRDNNYINLGLGSTVVLANGTSGYLFYETRQMHEFVSQDWLKLGVRFEF